MWLARGAGLSVTGAAYTPLGVPVVHLDSHEGAAGLGPLGRMEFAAVKVLDPSRSSPGDAVQCALELGEQYGTLPTLCIGGNQGDWPVSEAFVLCQSFGVRLFLYVPNADVPCDAPEAELLAGNTADRQMRCGGLEEARLRNLEGRTLLVTGAGGSVGSALVQRLVGVQGARLVLVDHDESRLLDALLAAGLPARLDSEAVFLADVRDAERFSDVVRSCHPDVIFHAAALKHVQALEQHPAEGVKTNVLGTLIVVQACAEAGVDRLINISTDKANTPTTVLGLTKLLAERCVNWASAEMGLNASSVRFANVLGSRGSVLQTFDRQVRNGVPLTVTDPRATRYFMTEQQAVDLLVGACEATQPGTTVEPALGQAYSILGIAAALTRKAPQGGVIRFTGLTGGEKLHESWTPPDGSLEEVLCSGVRVHCFSVPAIDPNALHELTKSRAPEGIKRELRRLAKAS